MALTLLKLGGELLEEPARLAEIGAVIAGATQPVIVVHGGGREIDAALKRAGIAKRQVEGLRVTDAATLDVVVEVLAGAVNTRLVAAIVKAGGRAVGLTGADAGLVPVEKAPAHRSVDGTMTDLVTGETSSTRDCVAAVLGHLTPVADRLGCASELAGVDLAANGAQRQRGAGSAREATSWIAGRFLG